MRKRRSGGPVCLRPPGPRNPVKTPHHPLCHFIIDLVEQIHETGRRREVLEESLMLLKRVTQRQKVFSVHIEERPGLEPRRVHPREDLAVVSMIGLQQGYEGAQELEGAALLTVLDGHDEGVEVGELVCLIRELHQAVVLGEERPLARPELEMRHRVEDR